MNIHRSQAAALVATLAIFAVASPGFAATKIDGDAKSVSIRLENSSIDEALKSLGGAFDVRYRASGSLDRPLSGTYRGPLKDVVKHLLNGYDFVLTTRGTAIEVSVLGKSTKSADVPVERNLSAGSKPAVTAQRTAPSSASVQAAMPDSKRDDAPAGASSDAAAPRPIVLAENDASKMPTPTPGKTDGPMPMPTPQGGGDGPVPRPDTSGSGPMPMPTPQGAGDGPVPTITSPTPNAQPASTPTPSAPSANTPKPN